MSRPNFCMIAVAAAVCLSPMGLSLAVAQPAAAPAAAPVQRPSPLLIKVTDTIYQVRNVGYNVSDITPIGGNVTIIMTPEGVVLVDAKVPAMHDDLMAKIASLTKAPVKYVILTHNHPDHSSGAEQMKAAGDVVITSQGTRENLIRNGQVVRPQVAYSGQTVLFPGGVEMRLTEYTGHTRGDTTVYLPESKLLIAGDLVTVPDEIPGIVNYGDGGGWEDWGRTLDAIAKVDFDQLIGGHGPVLTKAEFLTFKSKIDGIRSRVRELNRQRKTAEEIGQTLQREFNWGNGGPGGNIVGMMQELR